LDIGPDELRGHESEHDAVPVKLAVVEFQPPVDLIDKLHGIAHFQSAAFQRFVEIGGVVDLHDVIEDEAGSCTCDLTVIAHAGHQECACKNTDEHYDTRHDHAAIKPHGQQEHQE